MTQADLFLQGYAVLISQPHKTPMVWQHGHDTYQTDWPVQVQIKAGHIVARLQEIKRRYGQHQQAHS